MTYEPHFHPTDFKTFLREHADYWSDLPREDAYSAFITEEEALFWEEQAKMEHGSGTGGGRRSWPDPHGEDPYGEEHEDSGSCWCG